jgi:hypothetical protein
MAALALTGVTAATASAEETGVWLLNGAQVKESTSVTNTATEFQVRRQETGEGEEIYKCTLGGKGTVSAKGAGTISAFNLTSCTGSPKLPYGACEAGTLSYPSAVKLPWTTQLHRKSGGFAPVSNEVLNGGFTWQCKVKTLFGNELYKVTCAFSFHIHTLEHESEQVRELWQIPGSGLMNCERSIGPEKLSTGAGVLGSADHVKAEKGQLSFE